METIWSAAHTDVGTKKNINQDAVLLKVASAAQGKTAFAVICDGVGGLSLGEVASSYTCESYGDWFTAQLPGLLQAGLTKESFAKSLWNVTRRVDEQMKRYSQEQKLQMGTTATALLIVKDSYYIFHVGDTRVYQLSDSSICQLTTDHTCGQMNVLLQCVGASCDLKPEVIAGKMEAPVSFLLCSDGFRNKIEQRELFEKLRPSALQSEGILQDILQNLTEWNKTRGETDNLSAVALKIF